MLRAPLASPGARVVALGVVLTLAGCSFTETIAEKGRIDYRSAGKLPPLDLPPDLTSPKADDRYTVPELAQRDRTYSGFQSGRVTDRAQSGDARVLPPQQGVRIERIGTQRWLVVEQSPDKLWPILREFWRESGFSLSSDQPEIGLMETEWAENRAKIPQDIIRRTIGNLIDGLYSSPERDRFRTRLEVAASGATEIYISHRGLSEEWTSERRETTIWKPRPADPELEAEFLRRLMVKLGSGPETAQRALAPAAEAQSAEPFARIVTAGLASQVEVREGFDRAWRRVGLVLDRAGFTVEDRNRSQGVYYVRYIDPEVDGRDGEKPGFFSRLFSRDVKAVSSQQYRIKVDGGTDLTRVSVIGKDGAPLSAETDRRTAQKILGLLRDQLQQ